jgi:hypothetical protein
VSTTAATTSAPATTGTTEVTRVQLITLVFPPGTAVDETDIRELITRAGGDAGLWNIEIVPDEDNNIVVFITADVNSVAGPAALQLEGAISEDPEFVAANGDSSVRLNVPADSSANCKIAAISALLVVFSASLL